ncbi:MAG: lysylphosphatidylglycerol synthase domain-containing protein [Pirellulales bacterium]
MTDQPRKWTRWLIPSAKLALAIVLCWGIYRAFIDGNETLGAHSWHADTPWLLLSGVLYLLGILPPAIFWHQVLLRVGQNVSLASALRAYYISQLGKYVPGKWMVILLRRVLLHKGSTETTVVAATVFFETFTFLSVGSAVAAVVLIIWHPHQLLLIAAAIGATLMLGIPTVPACFQWIMGVLRVGKLNPTAAARFAHIGWRTMLVGWIMIALGWLLQGASLWAVLRAMDATTGGVFHELSLHTTAVSLGIVAGFVSQIPGGLLVREWVAGELLEPVYGPSVALVATIILRLVLLVSEVAISIIVYLAGWRRSNVRVAPIQAPCDTPAAG